MIINRESAETTIIEREPGAPSFRMFDVADSGKLTLNGLTVRGGAGSVGAGILNTGSLAVNQSIIERNGGFFFSSGGGITNRGILTITLSILTENNAFSGGGILNSGKTRIMNSSITRNLAAEGGGIFNGSLSATMIIQNSTISENGAQGVDGGLLNDGQATIINTTIADNGSPNDGRGNCQWRHADHHQRHYNA